MHRPHANQVKMSAEVYACKELTGATSFWFDAERHDHCATFAPHHNPPGIGGLVELHWPARTYRVAGMVTHQGGERIGPFLTAELVST